jgi:hypothetical protein
MDSVVKVDGRNGENLLETLSLCGPPRHRYDTLGEVQRNAEDEDW